MSRAPKKRHPKSEEPEEDCGEEISSDEIQLQSRYRLIEALSTAERKASARVENLLEIVFEIDADGIVTFLNRAWEHSIGHVRDDVLGCALVDFVYEEDSLIFQSAVEYARVNKGCAELRVKHSAGHLVAVSMCLTSSNAEDGGFLGSFHDVTHDRDVREQLTVAKEAAENANRTKSEFLAAMSHEIRTPLNALLGMSDLLTLTELTPVQSRYLQSIQSNSEMLLTLVCDILDVSKIEAELMEFESRPFSPSALLEEVAVSLAARSEAKGLELVTHCESTLPQSVLGDACRIRQILLNIVGNAIKFTKEGDIVVSVRGEQREDSCWMICFEVRDTGIGIAEDVREQIFERFMQGSSSTNREFGGTGLGLNISRSLVEMMGGSIDFQSRIGEGTTFSIELCLPMVKEPKAVQLPGACDIRALIVEPNRAQREALAKTLVDWGIHVDSVSSLKLAQEALRTQDCSLLFVDIQLCQNDSDDVVGSLRRYVEDHSISPIFVGSMGLVGRGKHHVFGNATTLSKPICSEPLLRVIMATLYPDEAEADRGGALLTAPETVSRGQGERILVVEDNRDNQFFIERVLEIAGYDVDIASTGAVGAQKAKENDYHLIVMDIEMPKMDGFACTQAIRSWERE
ncbi:MAG: response regulator, partial [Kofleriaceae bacterium]|nr:response regulator [Kofleriaceae bacterium]